MGLGVVDVKAEHALTAALGGQEQSVCALQDGFGKMGGAGGAGAGVQEAVAARKREIEMGGVRGVSWVEGGA